ncbi:DNA-binding response regulator [Sphaerotilus sp.]|uniref:response regulator transcription factor n=1 Tax=Sphaerotilus sp. TaxID=2093942 RepID=UPI002ACD7311|nr:DNA-binding response regulator [Sphaerotilus sp.]MDZ7856272.1 DNA-binding response regulator [Sphaerotilus sp.]
MNILIVEDDRRVADFLERGLRAEGHRVQVARTGPEGLQMATDLDAMRVTRAGQALDLTARELALLELLMSAPGRLYSRERILANVWGVHEDPLTNVVDVYIRRLRSKIDEGQGPSLIHTVRGLGYRLEAPG